MRLRITRILLGAGLVIELCGCAHRERGLHGAGAPRRDRLAAQRWNDEALELLANERFEDAEKLLRRSLTADAFFGPAHCNLGVCLLELGKYYDAGWHLNYAAKLMPRASQPRVNLGVLYEKVGKYDESEQLLRAALERAPDHIEIIGQLARVHLRQDKCTSETLAWLQQVAAQDDDPAWRDWARRAITFQQNRTKGQ